MRDFYDVYILYDLKIEEIDLSILQEALIATANSRGTFIVIQNGDEIIEDVLTSEVMLNSWKKYQKRMDIYLEMKPKAHNCPCCQQLTDKVHDYRTQIIKDIPAFGMISSQEVRALINEQVDFSDIRIN